MIQQTVCLEVLPSMDRQMKVTKKYSGREGGESGKTDREGGRGKEREGTHLGTDESN